MIPAISWRIEGFLQSIKGTLLFILQQVQFRRRFFESLVCIPCFRSKVRSRNLRIKVIRFWLYFFISYCLYIFNQVGRFYRHSYHSLFCALSLFWACYLLQIFFFFFNIYFLIALPLPFIVFYIYYLFFVIYHLVGWASFLTNCLSFCVNCSS